MDGYPAEGYPSEGFREQAPLPEDDLQALPEVVDQFATLGSATGSLMSGMEDGSALAPSMCDIKRLQKLKVDQEQRLKALCVRVDRLTSQEQKVWKDVAYTQQRSLHAQEKQWQRQAQEGERLRMERELMVQEQALRERARQMRMQTLENKDLPRLQKFDENRASSRVVREDSERHARSMRNLREQELKGKNMQVELRRQQRRQLQLQRELEFTRKEQLRQDANMSKFGELQEEIQNAELAIAVAEREELSAVNRLQNSQTVRSEVVTQLQDIEKLSAGLKSPRSGSPVNCHYDDEDDDGVPMPSELPPRPVRSGAASVRNTRSSPRLAGGGSSPSAVPAAQSSRGRLGNYGSRSTPGLVAASGARTDLGQITEEEAYADAKKKTLSGPRSRALQMQRAKQSPVRPQSANNVHNRAPTNSLRGQRIEY